MLTAKQIAGFTKSFLLKKYDSAVPIPQFHYEMWDLAVSGSKRVCIAAPRHHAKSTAITHAFILASVLFRQSKYVLLVSDTESQASNFLMDIKSELLENDDIKDIFGIRKFSKEAVTDIIVEMHDGWKFRITAIGAEMKVRGRKWGNSRPDLIVCDDLENDEMVESEERREKFRKWFFKALVPSLSSNGIIVVVGTILHLDSLLYRLLKNNSWKHLFFKAHNSFNDFSGLLWPEKWSEEALRAIRDEMVNDGTPEAYSQEYLNNPIDQSEAYFRKTDFVEMDKEDYERVVDYYAAIDFAISDVDKSAYTVIVVAGLDHNKKLLIKYVLRFRGDADEIILNLIAVQQRFGILLWKAEKGQISLAIGPSLYQKMQETGVYLNIDPAVPTKDKRARARSIQARMRAGAVKFDKKADWYPTLEEEMLQFPKGQYKDQVDAMAWLGMMIDQIAEGPTKKELADEEYEDMVRISYADSGYGRDRITGY